MSNKKIPIVGTAIALVLLMPGLFNLCQKSGNFAYADSESIHVLPDELLEICKKHGLDEVANFREIYPEYSEQGPYVYGILDGPEQDSAAFWCMNKVEERYYLAVMIKGADNPLKSCPQVQEVLNDPMGLSVKKNFSYPGTSFLDWAYVNMYNRDPSRKGASGPLIVSGDDTFSEEFFCLDDEWVVVQYD